LVTKVLLEQPGVKALLDLQVSRDLLGRQASTRKALKALKDLLDCC
jgi:hypothetical protein